MGFIVSVRRALRVKSPEEQQAGASVRDLGQIELYDDRIEPDPIDLLQTASAGFDPAALPLDLRATHPADQA